MLVGQAVRRSVTECRNRQVIGSSRGGSAGRRRCLGLGQWFTFSGKAACPRAACQRETGGGFNVDQGGRVVSGPSTDGIAIAEAELVNLEFAASCSNSLVFLRSAEKRKAQLLRELKWRDIVKRLETATASTRSAGREDEASACADAAAEIKRMLEQTTSLRRRMQQIIEELDA